MFAEQFTTTLKVDSGSVQWKNPFAALMEIHQSTFFYKKNLLRIIQSLSKLSVMLKKRKKILSRLERETKLYNLIRI